MKQEKVLRLHVQYGGGLSIVFKLCGGTAPLQVEMGRWRGVKREERICKECNSGEVEDVIHWLLRCPTWNSQRQPLMKIDDPT